MPIHNTEIAAIFDRYADLLEIYGANEYRGRVHRNASRNISSLSNNAADMVKKSEDRGEIEAARDNRLPSLVKLDQIRGDLHAHTKATDGLSTLEQMALTAQEKGYQYLAITEHSKHVTVAKGLDTKRLMELVEEIDRLNEKLDDFVVLKSIEVDILEDVSLRLPKRQAAPWN